MLLLVYSAFVSSMVISATGRYSPVSVGEYEQMLPSCSVPDMSVQASFGPARLCQREPWIVYETPLMDVLLMLMHVVVLNDSNWIAPELTDHMSRETGSTAGVLDPSEADAVESGIVNVLLLEYTPRLPSMEISATPL